MWRRSSDSPSSSEEPEETTTRGAVWIPTHLRSSEDDASPKAKSPQAPREPWNDRGRGRGWVRGGGRGGRGRGDHSSRNDPPKQDQAHPRGRGRGRGGWLPRGRGGFIPKSSPSSSKDASPPSPARHPVGPLIESLTITNITTTTSSSSPKPNLKLTNFQHLASYNWLDTSKPSLAVPGTPRVWSPQPPRQLPLDSGIFHRDHDAHNHPSHPIQPAIEALLHTFSASPPPSPVHLVACSNTLTSLYCFAAGEDRPFRMLAESLGGVLHLIRRENPEDEIIPDVRGYGHTFADANAAWPADLAASALHQRIVRHEFAGIATIIRFVADGFLPDKAGPPQTTSSSQKNSSPSSSSLTVSPAGRPVPHAALFDLKTRSILRPLSPASIIADYLPRLWLCQIPNFVVALHSRGTFTDVSVHDVRPDLARWEAAHQDVLARFAALLRRIMAAARARPDGKLEIIHQEGAAVLELREQTSDAPSALPDDTEGRWKAWLAGPGPASDTDESSFFTAGSDEEDDSYMSRLEQLSFSSDDDDQAADYTACSAEDCGYCGRCTY